MEAVVSMYEDCFDLCTLQSQLIEEPSKSQAENFSWWKKLTVRQSGSLSTPSHCVVISHFSMPVKRTKELRALTGWRYYFSLFLELSDITMPLIRAIFTKVSDAVSFFLVCLIGRSLGLIYTGIRQSLRWNWDITGIPFVFCVIFVWTFVLYLVIVFMNNICQTVGLELSFFA